jgi:hypothetical protein
MYCNFESIVNCGHTGCSYPKTRTSLVDTSQYSTQNIMIIIIRIRILNKQYYKQSKNREHSCKRNKIT